MVTTSRSLQRATNLTLSLPRYLLRLRTLWSIPHACPSESSLTQRPTPTSMHPTGPSLSRSAGIHAETSTPEWGIYRIEPHTCWISFVVMERLSG
jgi:hypothetical protein